MTHDHTSADDEHQVLIDVLEIAPDGTTHTYWSTHCRHSNHDACSAREITARDVQDPEGWSATIERKPAQCKTCASPCICPCHVQPTPGTIQPRS